jgi:hypothetical protein
MNADTTAPIFVWGFFAFFAGVGLFAGAASATVIGGAVEWLLRHIGIGIVPAIGVATLVSVVALSQMRFFKRSIPDCAPNAQRNPTVARPLGRSPPLTRVRPRNLV